jgi:hypothetical protein
MPKAGAAVSTDKRKRTRESDMVRGRWKNIGILNSILLLNVDNTPYFIRHLAAES